jgi:hypothetical protein
MRSLHLALALQLHYCRYASCLLLIDWRERKRKRAFCLPHKRVCLPSRTRGRTPRLRLKMATYRQFPRYSKPSQRILLPAQSQKGFRWDPCSLFSAISSPQGFTMRIFQVACSRRPINRHPPDDGLVEAEIARFDRFWQCQFLGTGLSCTQASDIYAPSAENVDFVVIQTHLSPGV